MSRKLLTLVCSSLLVLSFGQSAFAQADVRLTAGGNLIDSAGPYDGNVGVGLPYTYTIEVQNMSGSTLGGATIGFEVYSPTGDNAAVSGATLLGNWVGTSGYWDAGGQLNTLNVDGTLPDLLLYGGVAIFGGHPDGTTWEPVGEFVVTMPANVGAVICVDSAFVPPAGEWLTPPAGAPTFQGGSGDGLGRTTALCFETFVIPDLDPEFAGPCPGAASGSHCDPINFSRPATDPDGDDALLTYSVSHNGAGSATVDGAGNVTYTPDAADVGSTVTVTVTVSEPDGPSAQCDVDVTVTNNDPVATCPPNLSVSKGNSVTSPAASVADPDPCDGAVWSLVSVSPTPAGTVSVDPATGAVTFDTDVTDAQGGADTDYTIELMVSDGISSSNCSMVITVLNTEPFCVSLDQTDIDDSGNKVQGTLQGGHATICINYEAGTIEVGGFDFLISYDASALSFVGASEGSIYADYEWEYFTYRFGPNGNCNGGCPSGKLRVVGLAEQNDGMHHPLSTSLQKGDTFACLDFLVSNDRNLECQFVPVRFCWLDCGDNALSSVGGDTTFISRNVFDWSGTNPNNIINDMRAEITGSDLSFPTLTGAPPDCDVATSKGAPVRFVDYKNGGIKIICADSIDARGDVNLNGLANEIADAVMLTEYFVSGLAAFSSHIEGSIAASEINGDGIPLTVADLVYLIRVIVGDALPLPKAVHNTAMVSVQDGVVSTNVEMGAALFVFEGDVNVELLADNMEIKTGVVDGNTHALVYSISTESIAAGNVVAADANLISVEAADYYGAALDVVTNALPSEFTVSQNYPNPFNPSTKITVGLPTQADYKVSIYNVAGQLVDVISGNGVGNVEVEWNADAYSSGVYFYKVEALGLSVTKKMMLLK